MAQPVWSLSVNLEMKTATHVHMNASALDSDGMDTVLNKHADKLQRHFENTLRRMNR